jgi:threonylcarbamoyladenosine tRNA methylthiotransferase MtaB
MTQKTVCLKSIGCRTNQEEMAGLSGALSDAGYRIVPEENNADIIIINTCSVTAQTESKTRRMIASLSRQFPRAQILVTGCYAQQLPLEIDRMTGVTWTVGNARKKDIVAILNSPSGGIFHEPLTIEHSPVTVFHDHLGKPSPPGRTRFALKIQEGCDLSCSYCIVPRLRGPSRSVPKKLLLETGSRAIDAGYKELVITGTHIGQYAGGAAFSLPDLVQDLSQLPGDFRIRLSSLDPRECTKELLDFIRNGSRLCKHLHISVQSFSKPVLEKMHRADNDYDSFIERMIAFRSHCPDAGIGGDFIVGFPGETPEMFSTTITAIKAIGFSYGHVFRFSSRPGTVAAAMTETIDEKEKIFRSGAVRTCLQTLRKEFITRWYGTTHRIIIEQHDPSQGLTSSYIRVEIPALSLPKNSWQSVRLLEYNQEKNCCLAELVIQ